MDVAELAATQSPVCGRWVVVRQICWSSVVRGRQWNSRNRSVAMIPRNVSNIPLAKKADSLARKLAWSKSGPVRVTAASGLTRCLDSGRERGLASAMARRLPLGRPYGETCARQTHGCRQVGMLRNRASAREFLSGAMSRDIAWLSRSGNSAL